MLRDFSIERYHLFHQYFDALEALYREKPKKMMVDFDPNILMTIDELTNYYSHSKSHAQSSREQVQSIFTGIHSLDEIYSQRIEQRISEYKNIRAFLIALESCFSGDNTFSFEKIMSTLEGFVIQYELLKMINEDGDIDFEYIRQLFNQEEITNSENIAEINARYKALAQVYLEEVDSEEELENFLNSIYIKRFYEQPEIRDYDDNANSAREFFKRKEMAENEQYYQYELSPVFLMLLNYMNAEVVSRELNAIADSENLFVPERKEAIDHLQKIKLFDHIKNLGNVSYEMDKKSKDLPDPDFHPIHITWNDSKKYIELDLEIPGKFGRERMIIRQFPYGMMKENEEFGEELTIEFLESQKTNAGEVIFESLLNETAAHLSPKKIEKLVPIVSTLIEVEMADRTNRDIDHAIDAIVFPEKMSAFGIEGQMSTINGEIRYDYLDVDEDVLKKNVASFNYEYFFKVEDYKSVEDIITDNKLLEQYLDYCHDADIYDQIHFNIEKDKGGSVERFIDAYYKETRPAFFEDYMRGEGYEDFKREH